MDRCRFINSLSSSSDISIEEYILNHFEEVMLLYNLFGNCDTVNISVDNKIINPFTIAFKNKKDANEMQGLINGTFLHIYGDKYFINSVVDDKSIRINILNTASMG